MLHMELDGIHDSEALGFETATEVTLCGDMFNIGVGACNLWEAFDGFMDQPVDMKWSFEIWQLVATTKLLKTLMPAHVRVEPVYKAKQFWQARGFF